MKSFYLFFIILICSCSQSKKVEIRKEKASINLSRFESDALIAERKNPISDSNSKNNVIFFGSSTIRMWNQYSSKQFFPIKVLCHGLGGCTFPEMEYYSKRLLFDYKPSLIVIYCENDLMMSKTTTVEEVNNNFLNLMNKINDSLPQTKIIYLAMKHSFAKENKWLEMSKINDFTKKYASNKQKLYYVDLNYLLVNEKNKLDSSLFLKDYLHLNEKGYQKWADTLKPLIQNILKTKTNGQ